MKPLFSMMLGLQPSSLTALTRLSDEQLMAELRAGNNDALAVLFDRYHRLVLSIALRIVRDPGEAEDVMQTVFLDVFRSVAQFDPAKGSTKVWLLQYAYHRAINRRQHLIGRSFYSQEDIEEVASVLPQGRSSFGQLTTSELRRLVEEALATLGGVQKRVIELASYEGFTMREISDKTGDSLVAVRHHYYRGLEKLRSFIQRKCEQSKAAGE